MLSDVNTPQQSGSGGILVPILVIAGIGTAGYFGYKIYDKKREEEAIEKANKSALTHELNRKRTEQRIEKIEQSGYVKGVNSFGKNVNVNLFTQVKEAINEFYIPLTDKYGITKYIRKAVKNINETKVKNAFFNMPVSSVAKFAKIYNLYTGKTFVTDAQQLSPALYQQIKVIFEIANRKFPQSFK